MAALLLTWFTTQEQAKTTYRSNLAFYQPKLYRKSRKLVTAVEVAASKCSWTAGTGMALSNFYEKPPPISTCL